MHELDQSVVQAAAARFGGRFVAAAGCVMRQQSRLDAVESEER